MTSYLPSNNTERDGQLSIVAVVHNRISFAKTGGYDFLHPSLLLANVALKLIPTEFGNHIRASVLRRAGFYIGYNVALLGAPRFSGRGDIRKKLSIGAYTSINTNCLLDLNESIVIGERVGIGPDVMLLTSTHEIGPPEQRIGTLQTRPVVIGDGAWLGARVVVLPGVTIGAGAVVSAGSVVARDVPPNVLFAGVPARLIQHL